ncbi:hypothetical protein CNR22_19925 [Sphingobacteriaceae bacterium]|nr:hypothetical protein CNR22_19925 [Sphingobacteriaceae bacterium]
MTKKNIKYRFTLAGNYPVVLFAQNKWGCKDTVIKPVLINDEFGLYIPNAFTPNGDRLNDLFKPQGSAIKKYSIEIFYRWGESIF